MPQGRIDPRIHIFPIMCRRQRHLAMAMAMPISVITNHTTSHIRRRARIRHTPHIRHLALLFRRLPSRRPRPLRILPRTLITKHTTALALTTASEHLGQILFRHLAQQLLLVTAAQDMDFIHGDRVQEPLDERKHGAETPGGVDDVQLPQPLRVVVLADAAGLLDVVVDGGGLAEADAFKVHDCAAGFQEGVCAAGAGGQAGVGDFFVLDHEVGEHAFGGGDFVHGGEVDFAELFDVERAAVLGCGGRVSLDCYWEEGGGRCIRTLSILW